MSDTIPNYLPGCPNTSTKISRRLSPSQISRPYKRRKSVSGNLKSSNIRKLPPDFINCDKQDLVTIIARMLTSIVNANNNQTDLNFRTIDQACLTRFHSRSPPQISIYDYLARLTQYSVLENSVLIAAVYYIDLLTSMYPTFALNGLTVHRFLLTATTVASKALCDSFCSNSHYAKVGGVNIIELNLLEVEFLTKVGYRVVPRDFNHDDPSIVNVKKAENILDLYYNRMVAIVGVHDKENLIENNDKRSNNRQNNDRIIKVGNNDGVTYLLTTESPRSIVIDESDDEYDEHTDNYNDIENTTAVESKEDFKIIENNNGQNISSSAETALGKGNNQITVMGSTTNEKLTQNTISPLSN